MTIASSGPPDLTGQTAVVTGAAGGIGASICETLAREGADIVAADLDAADLDAVAERVDDQGQLCTTVPCDVSDPNSVLALRDRALGQAESVEIVVTSHGTVTSREPFWEMPFEDWERDIAVNLTGTFLVLRAFYEDLLENRFGKVVCIGSISGRTGGIGHKSGYEAAKGGIHSFVKGLAPHAADNGVYVNAVAPGLIRTPLTEGNVEMSTDYAPLPRVGEPADVAEATLFLASQQSNWITGKVLDVNGGALMV